MLSSLTRWSKESRHLKSFTNYKEAGQHIVTAGSHLWLVSVEYILKGGFRRCIIDGRKRFGLMLILVLC
jgi:hypothetical protein